MEAWMGWALFALLVALIGAGIANSIRRARAIRDTAGKLGLTYQPVDATLARTLSGIVPMFAHDEILCNDVSSYKTLFGTCHLFRYSYIGRNAAGRRDRESVGLVACLESNAGPISERVKPQRLAAASEHWKIEHDGEWLAMRRLADRGDDGFSGDQLRAYHADVQKLLAMLFGKLH